MIVGYKNYGSIGHSVKVPRNVNSVITLCAILQSATHVVSIASLHWFKYQIVMSNLCI